MKISLGITVKNEGQYLSNLLNNIFDNVGEYEYEIIILDDFSDDPLTKDILSNAATHEKVSVYQHALNNHFANQKNYLNSKCIGTYIFQVDCDETISPYLLQNLHTILEQNNHIDLFWVPRINTVEGLTQEHIQQWRWAVNEKGWVNFPDYQSRIYKNNPEIKWKFAVHEIIEGHDTFAKLPADEVYALTHHKTITRQELQNQMYSKIRRV